MASVRQDRHSEDAPPEASRAPQRRIVFRSTPTRDRWVRRLLEIIAGLMLIGALKFAQAAIVPVLIALFLAVLLSPAVEALQRLRVPRFLAAAIVVLTLLAAVASCLTLTWHPAREWLDTAPQTFHRLEVKLKPVMRFIGKVQSVSNQAEKVAEPVRGSSDEPTPVAFEPKGLVQSTQEWVVTLVSMLFLTLFALGTDISARGRRLHSRANAVVTIFERVRRDLGRFFSAVMLSNLCLGIGTAIAMYLLHMPNPLLWGLVAFTLNFIPYAGSATTLALLTVVALVSFDGVAQAVWVAGTYLVLTTLEGQVLQPVLVGRRLDVSPPIVLLGLWFGGWLWGVAGIALAMPVLVSVKAAKQEIDRTRAAARGIEVPAETVRSRASAWFEQNAQRYRRATRSSTPQG